MIVQRLIVVSLLLIVAIATPCVDAEMIGTTFTYQGVLSDAGAPVAGTFDFRVFLYNAETGGSQVGSTVFIGDIVVTDGRVAVNLDFGDVFDGTALWLEIHLRESGTTPYTPLWPRQRLTATPFANHAASAVWADDAGSALSADNATQLGGQSPSYYLAWSNLTGLPDGLDDGDDDTLADLSCSDGEIIRWTGTAWNCSAEESPWSSTYVVGPIGSAVENGVALLAALAAISTPAGPIDAALLRIEPGIYDLDGSWLVMKPWVDIEGSGPGVTEVRSNHCGTTSSNSEVIKLAQGAELRDLAVVNSCSTSPGGWAVGISTTDDDAIVRNVWVFVTSGAERAWGITNYGGTGFDVLDVDINVGCDSTQCDGIAIVSGPTSINRAQILAQGGGSGVVQGINCVTDAIVTLSDIAIEVENGGEFNTTGVRVWGGAYLTMHNVTVVGGGTGIDVRDPHAVLTDVAVTSESPLNFSTAPGNDPSDTFSVHLENVRATGSDLALVTSEDTGVLSATIRHSQLTGFPYTVGNNGADIDIGGSYLYSSVSSWNGGTERCAANWDETYSFYPDTCP